LREAAGGFGQYAVAVAQRLGLPEETAPGTTPAQGEAAARLAAPTPGAMVSALDKQLTQEWISDQPTAQARDHAQDLACGAAAGWLQVPPIRELGLTMPHEAFRRELAFRLQVTAIPEAATGTSGVNCPACGTVWDDAQGLHAVGCAPQKATRHNAVRDFLIRKLREAHVVAHCEQ